MIIRAAILSGAILLAPFDAFLGQSAPTSQTRITGVVVDSIRGAGLQGAVVMVSGLASTFATDSLGRFVVEGIAPGRYEVGVFHPVLEALGLTLTTKPFLLGHDSTGFVNLAIPSAKTLAHMYCATGATEAAAAVIAGRVRDPDSDEPVRGASVSLAWSDISVRQRTRLERTPHELHTETDSSGFFKFCGLPADLYGTVQAARSGVSTGEVSVSTSGNALTFENLAIAPARAVPFTGVVRGTVFSLDDKPLARARVEASPAGVSAVTGADGTFSLAGVPIGTQLIVVRHLGFAPVDVSVTVRSREPAELKVTLGPTINVMDPVIVTARRNYTLEKQGFFERKRSGWGTYLTRDDIEKWHPQAMTDALRDVPGIRIRRETGGAVVEWADGVFVSGCTELYVDGMRRPVRLPGDVDAFVSAPDVIGIEVYRRDQAPVQFRPFYPCAVIVVWTQFQPR